MRRATIGFWERDALIEELAKRFYSMQGYRVRDDYRMQDATHPQEVLCVQMAIYAIDRLAGEQK